MSITELTTIITRLISESIKVELNGQSDLVSLASLGAGAKKAGINYSEFSCSSLLELVQKFKGIELYKDDNIFPPVYYIRKSGELTYSYNQNQIPQITDWAYLGDYLATFEDLSRIALHEDWGDCKNSSDQWRHPILENYIKYTFQKLYEDNRIETSKNGKYAVFNTGLVDNRYMQIYAVFEKNRNQGYQEWILLGFCISGENRVGKILVSEFSVFPKPAEYFSSIYDLLYDYHMGLPALDNEHIILERIDRFPYEFISQHSPSGFKLKSPEETKTLPKDEYEIYYSQLSEAIKADIKCYRSYCADIKNALDVAIKRVQWNYKSAVPMYYPRKHKMCLFLPLSLSSDDHVDLALVVEKTNSGRYQGATIYPLDWAYKYARLICRPDSDWLRPSVEHTNDE